MPSQSLKIWRADRLPALNATDAQCSACSPAAAPNAVLLGENLRGYVMLLSAHFQGFCRDLYGECVQAVAKSCPPALRTIFQLQCFAGLQLEKANPTFETLRKDFNRLVPDISLSVNANPANKLLVTHLGQLAAWRNHAAHSGRTTPASGPLALASVRGWLTSCDGLAQVLDAALYNELSAALGSPPW